MGKIKSLFQFPRLVVMDKWMEISLVNVHGYLLMTSFELMASACMVNPSPHSSASQGGLPWLHIILGSQVLCMAHKSFHNLGSAALSGMTQYMWQSHEPGNGPRSFPFEDPLSGSLFSQVFKWLAPLLPAQSHFTTSAGLLSPLAKVSSPMAFYTYCLFTIYFKVSTEKMPSSQREFSNTCPNDGSWQFTGRNKEWEGSAGAQRPWLLPSL